MACWVNYNKVFTRDSVYFECTVFEGYRSDFNNGIKRLVHSTNKTEHESGLSLERESMERKAIAKLI